MVATIGGIADTGDVVFTVSDETQVAPVITSFAPTSGTPGTVVTIQGSNFVDVSAVRFGGMAAGCDYAVLFREFPVG